MTMTCPTPYNAALLLPSGEVFWGYGIGAEGIALGEICFNTAMSGYQEILTDPSYQGQIVTFTFPHIGNVGCNPEDIESQDNVVGAYGLIVREPITAPSNFRSNQHFNDWLKVRGLSGICGIDTRALTRRIRKSGAANVAIAFGASLEDAKAKLAAMPSMAGMELAKEVTCDTPHEWTQQRWALETGYTELNNKDALHVVAIDYGAKLNILRSLASLGCRITVLPATTTADEVLAHKPDGVFLSNGPGDPAATGKYAIPVIQKILDTKCPTFGICLGHQMLALALGGKTEKMHQGHRGANHPVKNFITGTVEITSQNHGFVVSDANLPATIEVTHRSLFDGTIAGIRAKDAPAFAVQYHPESSPGPHDSRYLFEQFVQLIKEYKSSAVGARKHA